MTRKFLILAFMSIVAFSISAQEEEKKEEVQNGWKFNGAMSLTASQVSFSNWAAGGENSYSLNGLVLLSADYTQDKHLWENDLTLGYGLMQQGDKEIRKTDDNIELNSKYGYKATDVWYYSAFFNFKTQFTEGYKYDDKAVPPAPNKFKLSNFLAPAYISTGIGMTYKPSKVFSLFISPISGKITIVNDEDLSKAGAYGVDPGDKATSEFGATLQAELNKDIMKNVNLLSKLTLFSSYTNNPQNIDVDWQLILNMKINDWLSANLSLHMIYDDDIKSTDGGGPEVQFKEVFGVGLSYKF